MINKIINIRKVFRRVENRGPRWISHKDFIRIAHRENYSAERIKEVYDIISNKNIRLEKKLTNKQNYGK